MVKYFLYAFILFSYSITFGQKAPAEGSAVQNLPIKKLLNNSSAITSLSDLSKKLTVIDFFGTWCSPCLRALPHLEEIRQQFKNDLNIVLVSNETEAQLNKFINARKNFAFPVIVDEDNKWNNNFNPPSLPYTVIVKQGKILAITTAENLTQNKIEQWLKTPAETAPVESKNKVVNESNKNPMTANKKSSNATIKLSQDFIYAAKTGDSLQPLLAKLKEVPYETLVSTLTSDDLKKAFWINIYNGFTQAALKANPDQYKDRKAFFTKKQIDIAGNEFSLDDIEHGILRHSKIKWSLGHFNKLFPSKREKQLRVKNIDYRIHFALNCGAKSCPPIAFYNPEILNTQLDLAAKAYLTGEASYDSSSNTLVLPKLMSWFRADFGGKKGMIAIAKKVDLIPENVHPKIDFKDYDWALKLDNYKSE